MREQIARYVVSLYKDIPMAVYEGLLTVLCLGMIGIIAVYGLNRGWKLIVGLILAGYVFVIYCSTVIFRTTADSNGHEFKPFWSYEAIENGRTELITENLMNVAVFVPVGMMLGLLLKVKDSSTSDSAARPWSLIRARRVLRMPSVWLTTLIFGLFISVSIEAMQYFYHKGISETDDVMHNTIGCLLGFMIVGIIKNVKMTVRSCFCR